MVSDPVTVSFVAGVLALAGWLLAGQCRLRARLRAAERRAVAAGQAEAAAMRLLRLSAQELRAVGVRLRGQADSMGEAAAAGAAGLAAVCGQLFDIADALQDGVLEHEAGAMAVAPGGGRLLHEEEVDLCRELAEAAAQAQTLLAPGRRNWRLPPPGPAMRVWADRRALRHVLGRVLADAVRNTGQGDWIDIALRSEGDELVLVVEDEGGGVPALEASPDGEAAADSRGIGLRLTLARGLMEAHGGRLEVEAMPRVGSRISLVFPAARRRAAALPVI